MGHRKRIMYVEYKGGELFGPARIGLVTFSKSGRSVFYQGKEFLSLKGYGFKANYFDVATRDEYWISGCKKNGTDALYSTTVEIDDDIRAEYWTAIRNRPELKHVRSIKCPGKYSG